MSRWSYSRITTYEGCPRKYKYKYIEREKEAFESIEAFMGKRVHETIEWLYGLPYDDRRTVSHDDALRFYERMWVAEYAEQSVPVKVIREGDKVDTYQAQGAEIVHNFMPYFRADKFVTLKLEAEIEVELGGRYKFHGFIDRAARDPKTGEAWIIDYKTGKHAPDEFIGKEADQVRAYGLAALRAKPSMDKVNLRLHFVRPNKLVDGTITRSDMERIDRQLTSRIAAAEVQSYTTRVSRLCDWCGYNDRCEGPKKSKGGAAPLPF